MNTLFKALIPYCPRVHFSLVWEAGEIDESDEFIEYSVSVRAVTIVNGQMLTGESEFLDGIPVFDDEEPTDDDLITSGHAEELCKEALEALKADMVEGLPIEREISAALEHLPKLAANALNSQVQPDAALRYV